MDSPGVFSRQSQTPPPANQRPHERNDLSKLATSQSAASSLSALPRRLSPHSTAQQQSISLNMASSPQAIARLVASRRPIVAVPSATLRALAAANFSSSAYRAATPSGPPPSGFRLPPPKRWDQSDESSLDKASKYFLMSELFRGMYVVLEQFFRPP